MFTKILDFLHLSEKYFDFISKNSDYSQAFERLEVFTKNNYLFILTVDEYLSGQTSLRRKISVIFARISILLTILRFFISGLSDDPFIKLYLMDVTTTMGPSFLVLMALNLCFLCHLANILILVYFKMSNEKQSKLIKIFFLVKNKQIKYSLNSIDSRKYGLKINLMTRLIIDYLFNPFFIFYIIISIILTSIILFKYEITYQTIMIWVFWNICAIPFGHHLFSALCSAVMFAMVSTEYFKYKFNEINDKIELSLKQLNIGLLMNAIVEHNYMERLIRHINDLFRAWIFIIYYIMTFAVEMFLYVSHKEDVLLIGRIVAILILIIFVVFISYLTMIASMATSAAHRPYSRCYSILLSKRIRLTFQQRLKLLSFTEKLSGPDIGFYCYDLFPVNSYELYQYICISGVNYFLIMSLF